MWCAFYSLDEGFKVTSFDLTVKEGTHSGGPQSRKKVSRTKDFGDFEGERGSEASKKNPGGLFLKKKKEKEKKDSLM